MNTKRQDLHDWSAYYDATRDGDHFKLLDDALALHEGDSFAALDVGAGALRNTRFLLARGYQVDALDSSPLLAREAERLNDPRVSAYNQAYDNFTYPADHYGLIVAASALTFNPPQTFWVVLRNLRDSLAPGGVLCANFSGRRDEWAGDPSKSFVTAEELQAAFDGMRIVVCDEWECDTKMAVGGTKHSHIVDIIVQKPLSGV